MGSKIDQMLNWWNCPRINILSSLSSFFLGFILYNDLQGFNYQVVRYSEDSQLISNHLVTIYMSQMSSNPTYQITNIQTKKNQLSVSPHPNPPHPPYTKSSSNPYSVKGTSIQPVLKTRQIVDTSFFLTLLILPNHQNVLTFLSSDLSDTPTSLCSSPSTALQWFRAKFLTI